MENRRKFYTPKNGCKNWSTDSIDDRYNHIMWALDAYSNNNIDEDELKFIIKNGFVNCRHRNNTDPFRSGFRGLYLYL